MHGRAGRAGQGGPDRSDAPAGRPAVRRADRHRQDGDRQGAGRVPVRLGRADDPDRHERVPEPGLGVADARVARRGARGPLAGGSDPPPAVLRRAAGRVREGRLERLGPVPAGVRRRPAFGSARPGGRLPSRGDHHDLQPRCEGPDGRSAGVLEGRRGLRPGGGAEGRGPRVPAGVPQPDRSDRRLPATDASGHARDPRRRTRRGSVSSRPARAVMGGGVRRFRVGVPADPGVHARPRRAASEARGGAAFPDAPGAGDRRPGRARGRSVPVRPGRGRRPEGDLRGPERARGRGRDCSRRDAAHAGPGGRRGCGVARGGVRRRLRAARHRRQGRVAGADGGAGVLGGRGSLHGAG